MGESFSLANYSSALALQKCRDCEVVNYPPRERCKACLSDNLVWSSLEGTAEIVSCTQLNYSQWEFFKRKVKLAPWPIASVKLADQILFTHLAIDTFKPLLKSKNTAAKNGYLLAPGTKVKIFTQSDTGLKSVLIAVSLETDIATAAQRKQIAIAMGISE